MADRRGRMNAPHYKAWLTNTDYLIGEFSPALPSLVSTFYGKNLITEEDKKSLSRQIRKEGNTKAARCFVDMLLNRGQWILPDIIATLREATYNAASDKLETDMNAPLDSSESGKMKSGHLGVWTKLTPKLEENFKNHLDVLIVAFREAVILGDDEMKIIMNTDEAEKCDNPSLGATTLVEILANSGTDVLPKIIKVLDAKGFTVLAKELQSGIDALNEIIDDVVEGLPEVPQDKSEAPKNVAQVAMKVVL